MNLVFKILLVDDEPLLLKTHKRLLTPISQRLASYERMEINDAEGVAHAYAAIAFAASSGKQYDLVISDIDMRDGTGFDLLRMIDDKFGNAKPPTIMVSGLVDEARSAEAKRYGAKLYDKFDFSTSVVHEVANMVHMRMMSKS